MGSHMLGELAVTTGIWPLWEMEDGVLKLIGKTRDIADGRLKRLPVRDYLLKQGRFAHFTDDDIAYFQHKVDESWEKWLIPGVIPYRREIEEDSPPA
jgi:pyruvate ferredoxin oxidoreductase beta subunit